MGLIKAAVNATSGVFADEWKEFFACDSMSADTLIARGRKKNTGNNNGNDEIISNGSAIDVADGQAALIIEDGKIIEFTAEPGRFTWNTSSEPSCFTGGFFKGMLDSFKRIGGRFTYGGDPAKSQRVYYVNTKEIMDNRFGTATPMTYDDPYYKTVLYIRYFGQFSFKIADPIMFYTAVAGNVAQSYTKSALSSMITDEFMTALDSALAQCAASGIKFSQLAIKQRELSKFMKTELDGDWKSERGMEVCSVAIAKVTPDEKSRQRIEEYDTNVMHAGKDAMVGGLAYAQMEALKQAASNPNGSLSAFMGMGMAQNAAGGDAGRQTLIDNARTDDAPTETPPEDSEPEEAPLAPGEWKCTCGARNTGKFCSECGKIRYVEPPKTGGEEWVCSCGAHNTGKFCSECGKIKM